LFEFFLPVWCFTNCSLLMLLLRSCFAWYLRDVS
jgi:hypothetical protein